MNQTEDIGRCDLCSRKLSFPYHRYDIAVTQEHEHKNTHHGAPVESTYTFKYGKKINHISADICSRCTNKELFWLITAVFCFVPFPVFVLINMDVFYFRLDRLIDINLIKGKYFIVPFLVTVALAGLGIHLFDTKTTEKQLLKKNNIKTGKTGHDKDLDIDYFVRSKCSSKIISK